MEHLTEKERKVYEYVKKVIESDGYAPSVRDIQNALGIKSTSTVHSYIGRLESKGYIRKEQGKSRTLRTGDDVPDTRSVKIPVLGQVAAGMPILATENLDGYIEFCLPRTAAYSELFALRVKGESMIDAGIMDGDVVIVSRTSYVDNGNIAVVLVGDEATVKTFYRENGHFRLQPENQSMEPIIVNEAVILGRVIASVRYYG